MSETPTNATPDQPTPAQAAAPTKVEQRAGLWSRIKEHKILQWALGYAGAALALAHGQELLADTYEWPHLIGQVFMAMLILGLPIVLTLAWYHGHKGLKRISAAEAAIIALLLVIVGGGFFLFVHGSRESESREAKAEPAKAAAQRAVDQATTGLAPTSVTAAEGVTLAVLPFVNMSDDKEQEYFSDGLSEELINQLAQIEGLRVTGRTSSFYFKGKSEDLRVIGEKLGVANILEGSVRKAGNRLRITAQLVSARDGAHLWSEAYDRELSDVFAIQEDIGKAVAVALSIKLGVGQAAPAQGGTQNVEAHDLFLRAQAKMREGGASNVRAAELLREAVALDPKFISGWAYLAGALTLAPVFQPTMRGAALKERAEVIKRILALAPDSPAGQWALAVSQWDRHDWLTSERILEKASGPDVFENLPTDYGSFLLQVGRASDAINYLVRARSSDPLNLWHSYQLQAQLTNVGRNREAEAEYERSKDLPGAREPIEHIALIRAWQTGDSARIKDQFQRFLASEIVPMPVLHEILPVFNQPQLALAKLREAYKDPAYGDPTRTGILAIWLAHYGDPDLALEAFRQRGGTTTVIWMPVFRDVRPKPSFKALVRDLKLVDYWRASGHWADFCHPVGADDFECR